MRGSMQESSIASYWPSAAKLREGDRARSPALPASSKKRRRSSRVLQHAPPPPGNSGSAPPPRSSLLCRETEGEKSPTGPKFIAFIAKKLAVAGTYELASAGTHQVRQGGGRGKGGRKIR